MHTKPAAESVRAVREVVAAVRNHTPLASH
jgi:hypothetical protein